MITQKRLQNPYGPPPPLEFLHTPENTLTGIFEVDQALAAKVGSGGVILVCAGTGSGKSVLAGQIALNVASTGRKAVLISTELQKKELEERLLSSGTSWSYDSLCDSLRIEDFPGGLRIPFDGTSDPAFTHRALPLLRKLDKDLEIHDRRDFAASPLEVLGEILSSIQVPACLILDLLQFSGGSRNQDGTWNLLNVPKIAGQAMASLADYARKHRIPVFVFCQQLPDSLTSTRKRVTHALISEFKSIYGICDVFIGISHLRSSTWRMDIDGNFALSQYFHIMGAGGNLLVPVTTDFKFQRFKSRDASDEQDDDLQKRAAEMVLSHTKIPGFIQFRRDVFEELCGMRKRQCINVYALLLLVAEVNGDVKYGQQKIGKLLGLGRKPVCDAFKELEKKGLIRNTDRKRGRARIYSIVDFRKSQDCSPGYFTLAKNLRDPERQALLADPVLFRTWLALIYKARFSMDAETLDRGQLLPYTIDIAEITGDNEEVTARAVSTLFEQGRVLELKPGSFGGQVWQIANYDLYQNGASYNRVQALKTMASDPGMLAVYSSSNHPENIIFLADNTGPVEGHSTDNGGTFTAQYRDN